MTSRVQELLNELTATARDPDSDVSYRAVRDPDRPRSRPRLRVWEGKHEPGDIY